MILFIEMASGACMSAEMLPTTYNPPLLKAPYTLVFSVQNVQVAERTPAIHTPHGDVYAGELPPPHSDLPLTLTFSVSGHRILYLLDSGKWRNIIICDLDANNVYTYRNDVANAIVQSGVLDGIIKMDLLPMPGVGYDICPMFQSFNFSSLGLSHAKMVNIGKGLAATSPDGRTIGMRYDEASVDIDNKRRPQILKACTIYLVGATDKVSQTWTFSGTKFLGSVPISEEIAHVLYKPASVHFESHQIVNPDGSKTESYSYSLDPAFPMIVDRKVSYRLMSATNKALPAKNYDLETYLPPKCIITDLRKHL